MSEKLSERLHQWVFELKTDQDWTTLEKVQGIQQEVEALESRLARAQGLPEVWRKRFIDEKIDGGYDICADELEVALGGISGGTDEKPMEGEDGKCNAEDIGNSWNCVYYAINQKGNPCVAPKDFECEYKKALGVSGGSSS